MTLHSLTSPVRLAALLLCALAPLQSAHAEEVSPQVRAVFGTASFPCLTEATRLFSLQFFNIVPDRTLDSLREPLGKSEAWKRGDPNYEKVRTIVLAGLNDEVAKSGPLVQFSAGKLLGDVMAGWTPEQQRHYTAFFARPAGKLYLAEFIEGGGCHGLLRAIEQAPFSPLTGGEKTRYDALVASRKSDKQGFINSMMRLSRADQQSLGKEVAPLNAAMGAAVSAMTNHVDPQLPNRLKAVASARWDSISAAANAR